MPTIIKICLLLILSFWQLHAAPMTKDDVPEPLKPWVDWVLYNQDEQTCLHAYNSEQRFCAWPSALELALTNKRGEFSQKWSVKTAAWVRLPGNDKQWPHEVKLDGTPVVVTNRKGFPVVKLSAGEVTVHALLRGWQRIH